jgi:hypothetical protein
MDPAVAERWAEAMRWADYATLEQMARERGWSDWSAMEQARAKAAEKKPDDLDSAFDDAAESLKPQDRASGSRQ